MFLLTSVWPHYHCRLGILFRWSQRQPLSPGILRHASCPPLHWLDMFASAACFLSSMCPALSCNSFPTSCTYLFHPLHYRHPYYLRQYGWSTCFCSFRLLGPPVESPQPLPESRISCCSPQMSCVSRSPDQVSDDEIPIPRLCVTAPPGPSACAVATLLTVMMKFLFCVSQTVLLCFCVMVMLQFLSRTQVFLAFPPPPPLLLFALNLPRRLVADALSGMVNTDLLLLLRIQPQGDTLLQYFDLLISIFF
jgi:hypothetical protein